MFNILEMPTPAFIAKKWRPQVYFSHPTFKSSNYILLVIVLVFHSPLLFFLWYTSCMSVFFTTLLQPFYGSLDCVRDYPGEPIPERWNQEGKTNLDLLEQETVSGSRISWAFVTLTPFDLLQQAYREPIPLPICISPQTHNHASIPPLSFLQAGCPSCRPINSVKALKAICLSSFWL